MLKDGTTCDHDEPVNRGAANRPLTNEEIVEKYRANAALWTGPDRMAAMESAMLTIEDAPSAVSSFDPFCGA